MFTIKQLIVLALSGAAMAAPAMMERDREYGQGHWHGSWSQYESSDVATATETAAATYTVTYQATATAAAAVVTSAAAAAVVKTTAAATSTAAAATGTGYMAVVAKWRAAGGLPALTEDSSLQANALKTVTDSNGSMVHELNAGSMAQVLAPGNANNFESVYVGGWLCEVPTLAGLNGICATEAQGWDHSDGETGHADILTSKSYTKIGCALYAGIWGCDLA